MGPGHKILFLTGWGYHMEEYIIQMWRCFTAYALITKHSQLCNTSIYLWRLLEGATTGYTSHCPEIYLYIYIYILDGPSGHYCRCIDLVGVLVWSMFRCGWFLRSLRACRSQPPSIHGNWSIKHAIGSNWIYAYQLTLKVKFDKIALVSSSWPKFWASKC